jgi:hypothetical protein
MANGNPKHYHAATDPLVTRKSAALPSDSLESVYNPDTSSHGLAGVELTKLPLNALTSN